jgi:hypothetical protein
MLPCRKHDAFAVQNRGATRIRDPQFRAIAVLNFHCLYRKSLKEFHADSLEMAQQAME